MQAIKCPQCGAPAHVESGEAMHVCTFCNASFQLAQAPQERPQPVEIRVIMPERAPRPSTSVKAGLGAGGFAAILILGAIVSFVALRGGQSPLSGLGFTLGGWNGAKPFACSGNAQVHARGVVANFTAGSAVTIDGNCHFECEDCSIVAPIAASVRGNGQAVFVNGSVRADEAIADVSGNGRFEIRGNTRVAGGKPRKSANGQITGLPAEFSASATKTAAAKATPAPTTTKPTARPAATHR
jgi:hypothetical protein